jgi:EmrB/QacA subfamily drug resistance transporter
MAGKEIKDHTGKVPDFMEPPGPATTANGDVPAICHTPPAPVTPAARSVVLFIAVLAGFITPFDGSAVNIALPAMGAEFHMDAISLSWIATAYLLAAAIFLVPFGRIADIYGRKRIFLCGIAIFTLASFTITMVPTTSLLILVRIIQGFGGALIYGTSIAILTSVFPQNERGKALGIYITAVYFGLTLGPFLGGVLTQYFGWRSIFLVNVPIGILACILILWKLDGEWAECRGERFDLSGSVIYACALIAVMSGFSLVPDIAGIVLVIAGIITGICFSLYEMRIPNPVLDMRLLLRNRVFAFSNLAALIIYCATFAMMFLLSLDLQYTKGFSPEHAGLILIVEPAIMACVSPFAGRLSDRIDPQIVASAGMGLTVLGLFLLCFLTGSTPLWYIIICLAVCGVGFGLFSSPNTNAIMSAVEKRYYGVASGMNGTMRIVGQMLSMGIAMMIFSIIIGRVEITPEYYPQFLVSLHYAFILFTILCVFGIAASLMRKRDVSQIRD